MKDNNVIQLIERYKKHIEDGGLQNENFKWKLLAQFKGRPNLAADNFANEISSIDFGNLIYQQASSVIKQLAKGKTDDYKKCLQNLFNEDLSLNERISVFSNDISNLYQSIVNEPKHSHHHDERTIATLLSYKYPDKYTFYKDSYYREYCKLIGEVPKNVGEKYAHYLELIKSLSEDYIENDKELITLINNYLPDNIFNDKNHYLLAQDILYQSFDIIKAENTIQGLLLADSTDWFDNQIKQAENHKFNIIWNSKKLDSNRSRAIELLRDKIKRNETFDIFYLQGNNANYYAKVIDFCIDENEYNKQDWNSKYNDIYDFKANFDDYTEGNHKAKIVFLTSEFIKLDTPISKTDFHLFANYKYPIKDNIVPFTHIEGYETVNKSNTMKTFPLNQILYGPPGTGKTYNTINKALEIIGDEIPDDRREVKEQFDKRVNEGRIVFTTFHQSMSYEDFVEGIKPKIEDSSHENETDSSELKYNIESGIFKNACAVAAYQCYKMNINPRKKYTFNDLHAAFLIDVRKKLSKNEYPIITTKSGKIGEIVGINKNSSINVRPKETELNYSFGVTKENLNKLYDKFENISEIKSISQIKETCNIKHGTDLFAVFGSLKEFEKTIKPESFENEFFKWDNQEEPDTVDIVKSFNDGVYNEAVIKHSQEAQRIVLIIDEINRGNVSQIFGELITLIEEDKRLGKKETLEVTLPYSKQKFSVPANLYIIGTMNTADRSVEALDTALRRRFSFEEMPPKYDLPELDYEIAGFKVFEILKTINNRIEKLLDKDHQIGHSYFMFENQSVENMIQSFYKNIIPLLQEYFYGDYGKIGFVLGKGFIRIKETGNNLFADFEHDSRSDFEERIVYEIIDYRNSDLKGFENAIKQLMNQKVE